VSGLEQELRDLAARIEYPLTPDLVPGVRGRLDAAPGRLRRPSGRAVVVLLAALVAALAVAFAVPAARTAILRLFGVEGVSIRRVEALPAAPPATRANLALGRPITFAAAERRTPYRLLAPFGRRAGVVYLRVPPSGGEASFLLRCCTSIRLLSEFQGEAVPFAQKLVGPGTRVRPVQIGSFRGVWISGRPHVFFYRDREGQVMEHSLRLAGNTLLWQQDGLTLRLEGTHLRLPEALRVARSVS